MAEGAPADHGYGEAAGGGDGGDEEAGFVADATGRVLIDGGFPEWTRVEADAGVAHGEGECADFVKFEAVEAGGHEPGGELLEGDGFRGRAGDEKVNLGVGERETVAFFADEVDGVHEVSGESGLESEIEGEREQFAEAMGSLDDGAVFEDRKADERVGRAELSENLTAGSAGRAGGVVEVDDGNGVDAGFGSEFGYGANQG
uniref:Uncharacterized protein n=1 Tax=mine drainage metagenome TaxID=410659 RepID=E6QL87_9ZZZZ